MKNKKITAAILAAIISLVPFSIPLAAPSPSPESAASSTVTSPDGTTRTVSTGDNASPQPTQSNDNNTDADATSAPETVSPEPTEAPVSLGQGITMEDPTLTPPNIQYAQSALLMDMASGRVLYSKNLDDRVFPASTTKMMTGILALEMGNMGDTVTATYEALQSITLDDSQMGVLVGEELTMEQLVKSMLVFSANDSANVIAIHLAGSIDAFVEIMNNKAQELGMTGTHFVNPCGSHDDNHYTTARDLAILAKYAMKNEQFREIVKMPVYKIPQTNKYKLGERILVNTNLFLSNILSSYYYYPPAIGIKTGHTSQAGYCLVSAASHNDTQFLSVVMNCPNADTKEKAYSYIDSKTLFDFGFDHYQNQLISSAGDIVADSKVYEAKNDIRVAMTVENDVSALIPNTDGSLENVTPNVNIPDQINAPVHKGDVIGTITYAYNGIDVGTANLVATNDVERNHLLHVFHIIIGFITSPFFFVPAIILILVILFARQQKKKRERQKRIQQLKRNRQHNHPENETGKRTPNRNASRTERVDRETKGSNSRYRK